MYQQAKFAHVKTKVQAAVTKMVTVGIYWAGIKGRFGQKTPTGRRMYIAMKYGMRWRAKALMSRFAKE
jgi:hypothetical protein